MVRNAMNKRITIEDRIKHALGEQVFQLLVMSDRLDAAQTELEALKAKLANEAPKVDP